MKPVKPDGADLPQATTIQPSGRAPRTGGVRVSSRAEDVARLVVRAGLLGEIRQDRVEPLRQQIQAGVYKVPATEIAEAILLDEKRTLRG